MFRILTRWHRVGSSSCSLDNIPLVPNLLLCHFCTLFRGPLATLSQLSFVSYGCGCQFFWSGTVLLLRMRGREVTCLSAFLPTHSSCNQTIQQDFVEVLLGTCMIKYIRPSMRSFDHVFEELGGFTIGLEWWPWIARTSARVLLSLLRQQVSTRTLFDPNFQLFQPPLGGYVWNNVRKIHPLPSLLPPYLPTFVWLASRARRRQHLGNSALNSLKIIFGSCEFLPL